MTFKSKAALNASSNPTLFPSLTPEFTTKRLKCSTFSTPTTTTTNTCIKGDSGSSPGIMLLKEDPKKVALLYQLITPSLRKLEALFNENGFELRLVGGVVRDIFFDKLPKDVDLSTNALPEQMINMFKAQKIRYIETGLEHGTITIVLDEVNYEITTLRIDTDTNGRHATVQFTHNWAKDAERRDLTINSMSLDFKGNLFDYYNGLEHLKERKVVFVGTATERITEDYLRILRFFRFHGRIANDDSFDEETTEAITKLSSGLMNISGERIWLEMSKITRGRRQVNILKTMFDLGVTDYIYIPAYTDERFGNFVTTVKNIQSGQERLEEYIRSQGTGPDQMKRVIDLGDSNVRSITYFVSLLHDMAEFEVFIVKYKLSKEERRLGEYLITSRDIINSARTEGSEAVFDRGLDELVAKKPLTHVMELVLSFGFGEIAGKLMNTEVPVLPINGKEVQKTLGIKPGPAVGDALAELKNDWKQSRYVLVKEQLLERWLERR